jgi:hypothetical protein
MKTEQILLTSLIDDEGSSPSHTGKASPLTRIANAEANRAIGELAEMERAAFPKVISGRHKKQNVTTTIGWCAATGKMERLSK